MRKRAFMLLCRAVVAIAIAGAFSILAAAASAGTFTVYSCGGPAGATNHSFRLQADTGMAAYQANCPVNPYAANDNLGLVARAIRQDSSVGWLNGAYLIVDAPIGAQVGAIHADVNMNRPYAESPYWSVGVIGFGTDGDRGINTNQSMAWGCSVPASYNACFYTGHVDVPVSKPSVRFEARCGAPNFGSCPTVSHALAEAWVSAYNITVDVNDATLPSISVVGGGLSTGSWLRGDQSIRFDTNDNVGTRSTSLSVDGSQVTSWTNDCDFTYVVPCSNVSGGHLDYNVDRLSDGPHSLSLDVTDATGVDHYDVEVQAGNADWERWLEPATQTAATWQGSFGQSYQWRARAVDQLGNVSAWAVGGPLAMVDPSQNPDDVRYTPGGTTGTYTTATWTPSGSTSGTTGTTRTTTRRGAGLRVNVARIARGYVILKGRLRTRGSLTATAHVRPKMLHARTTSRLGRFTLRLRLPRAARRAARVVVSVSFAGNRDYAPAIARRTARRA